MKSSTPLVTIGMPTYNGAVFIAESLKSISGQTVNDFELRISDNASTDGTAEICQEFGKRDIRVVYQRSDRNRGAAWNFRRVLDQARGKYFMWASDHDLWHPEWLSRCVEVLETDPDVVIAYSHTMLIDAEGKELGDMGDRIDTRGMSLVDRYRHLCWKLGWGNMVYGLHRASALREVGGLSECYWSDQLLLGSLALRGTFVQIPSPLFLRRKNRGDETLEEKQRREIMMTVDPETVQQTLDLTLVDRKRDLRNRHLRAVLKSPVSLGQKAYLCSFLIEYFQVVHGVRSPVGMALRNMVAAMTPSRMKASVRSS